MKRRPFLHPSREHLMNVCVEGASPVDREREVTSCVNLLEKRKKDTSRQAEGLPYVRRKARWEQTQNVMDPRLTFPLASKQDAQVGPG